MRAISKMLAVLGILLIGTCSIGVAYTYTSSTDNTDNTSQTEYVVLSQEDGYTFGSKELTFTTVVIKDPQGTNPKIVFELAGSVDLSGFRSGYKGVKIGNSSSLQGTINATEVPSELSGIKVSTVGGTFADISGLDWYYVIKVSCQGEETQYVYCDGSTNQWQGEIDLTMQSQSNVTKKYTTELFLAVPTAANSWDSIPTNVISNGTIQYAYSSLENQGEVQE